MRAFLPQFKSDLTSSASSRGSVWLPTADPVMATGPEPYDPARAESLVANSVVTVLDERRITRP